MFLWFPVLDLARAPRRTARKKGSGYENDCEIYYCSSQDSSQDSSQPRTQDLSLGKTLAAAGHVPHQKFSARGGVGKVSNYINMLPV